MSEVLPCLLYINMKVIFSLRRRTSYFGEKRYDNSCLISERVFHKSLHLKWPLHRSDLVPVSVFRLVAPPPELAAGARVITCKLPFMDVLPFCQHISWWVGLGGGRSGGGGQ